MDCKFFCNNILNFYYQDLESNELAMMHEHLLHCPDCLKAYNNIIPLLNSSKISKEISPDPFFYTRLAAKLEEPKNERISYRLFTRLAQPLFVICLTIIGVFVGIKINNGLRNNATSLNSASTENQLISQLAGEYYMSTTKEENIETYYLSDK